jgi:hypothetical protein
MEARIAFFIVSLMFAVAISTAAPRAAAAIQSAPPPGYHTVAVKKAGFSIAVPDTWQSFDPTSKTAASAYAAMKRSDAKFASLPRFASFDSRIKLLALDPAGDEPWDVMSVELDQGRSLPTLQQEEATAKANGNDVIASRKTTVAGAPALEIVSTLFSSAADNSPVKTYDTAYVVLGKRGLLTFLTTTRDDGRQDPHVQTMIGNLTLLR